MGGMVFNSNGIGELYHFRTSEVSDSIRFIMCLLIGVTDFHQMLTEAEYSHHFENKKGPNQVRLLEQEGQFLPQPCRF